MQALQASAKADAEVEELNVREGSGRHLETGARAVEGSDPRERELQQRDDGDGPREAGAALGGEPAAKHGARRGGGRAAGSRARWRSE